MLGSSTGDLSTVTRDIHKVMRRQYDNISNRIARKRVTRFVKLKKNLFDAVSVRCVLVSDSCKADQ